MRGRRGQLRSVQFVVDREKKLSVDHCRIVNNLLYLEIAVNDSARGGVQNQMLLPLVRMILDSEIFHA